MSLKTVLAGGAIKGALAFLSELLGLLHSQFIAGTGADDETKKGLATFMLWYPELKQAAAGSDNKIDDQIVEELKQLATAVLPATFIASARMLDGPEDAATDPVEPAE